VFSPSVTRLPYGAMLNSNKRLRGCSRRRRSRRSFMWYSVRITARCGGGIHSITVSHKTFAEIRSGKVIRLQGDGFATEEGTVADHWEFNTDSLGSVKVYCDNEGAQIKGTRRKLPLPLLRRRQLRKMYRRTFDVRRHRASQTRQALSSVFLWQSGIYLRSY
jgi:hypothetical protein